VKPVEELTIKELKNEIAERLGWKLENRHYPTEIGGRTVNLRPSSWIVTRPDGSEVELFVQDRFSQYAFEALLRDWSEDVNAALEVCQQIAYGHHWLFSLIWSMNGDKDGRWLACFENRVDEYTYENLYHGSASDPALACARSALLALRGPDPNAYRVLNEDLTEIDEF